MDYVKNRAIEFGKWLVISRMWQTDLTFDELYEIWMEEVMVEEYENEKMGKEELMAQWDM